MLLRAASDVKTGSLNGNGAYVYGDVGSAGEFPLVCLFPMDLFANIWYGVQNCIFQSFIYDVTCL